MSRLVLVLAVVFGGLFPPLAAAQSAGAGAERAAEARRAWRVMETRRIEGERQARAEEARRIERRRRALIAAERGAASRPAPQPQGLSATPRARESREAVALAERARLERAAQARRAQAERAQREAARLRAARTAEQRRRERPRR